MYGLVDIIKNKLFPAGSKILIVHTGGLQGIDGFNKLLMKKKSDLKIF
jgi:1-aminocyclopropane-1-carboxylate deaminase